MSRSTYKNVGTDSKMNRHGDGLTNGIVVHRVLFGNTLGEEHNWIFVLLKPNPKI